MTSVGDLATVRSNPFQPPKTGRLSVAVWLRLPPSVPQPPLRIAVEGVESGEQYYRFAPVGAAAGGRPLQEGWSRFVLQVTDLPSDPNESLRLRFDMLGPGVVEIDEMARQHESFRDSRDTGRVSCRQPSVTSRLNELRSGLPAVKNGG